MMIQTYDRGRQGINRINIIQKQFQLVTKRKEQNRKVKEGKAQAETEENKESAACLLV